MWIARDDLKRSDFTKKTKAGDLYLFVNEPVLLSQYGMRFWAVDENEGDNDKECDIIQIYARQITQHSDRKEPQGNRLEKYPNQLV